MILAALLQAAQVLAEAAPMNATAECGVLGVMDVPEGADPSEYRQCAEHPVALLTGDPSQHHETGTGLSRRECWHGRAAGCSKTGWCYKRCCSGAYGAWCWTAKGSNGKGDWLSCNRDSDCTVKQACGRSNGGSCKECGCSC